MKRAICILACVLSVGCGERSSSRQPGQAAEAAHRAGREQASDPIEKGLAEQIAAVEAGESNEIRAASHPATDEDLAAIGRLASLERLNLGNGQFTEQGLAQLRGLNRLELLRIRAPGLTDAALAEIAQLPSLRFLHLIDVPVTDAGIAHLHSMTGLESLYLDGGRATDAGLQSLLEALPTLHFHRDQLHLPHDPHAD